MPPPPASVFFRYFRVIFRFLSPFRALIVEFIGTFFLVFTVGLNSLVPQFEMMAPLAIGSILMVMIYMGGHISGGHYNPSVTLGVYFRGGKISFRDMILYQVVQIFAAFIASLICYAASGKTFAPSPAAEWEAIWTTFVVELFFTFALVLVVLAVATTPQLEGNSFYGCAIGFTVVAGAYTSAGISGGAFNPALVIGSMIVDTFSGAPYKIKYIWVYWGAAVIGSILAPLVYHIINYQEDQFEEFSSEPAQNTEEQPIDSSMSK